MYVNMVMYDPAFVQRSENNHGYWPSMVLSLRQAAFVVFSLSAESNRAGNSCLNFPLPCRGTGITDSHTTYLAFTWVLGSL